MLDDNYLNTIVRRGYLKYVSKEPVHQKPAIFTSGGYTVKLENGEELIFDWLDSEIYIDLLDDGRLEIEVVHRNFDHDYYESSNADSGVNVKQVTAEFWPSKTGGSLP